MATLEELLRMPLWRKQKEAWKQLTKGDTLFVALREAVRTGSVGDAMRWVAEWQVFATDERTQWQWHIVRTLVWCAEQAATRPDFYRTEIDRVCFALANIPDFIKSREVWAWICIRSLLLDAPRRCLHIPVAGWDQRGEKDGGFLATLVLEVLGRGAGQVAHHPADVFCTSPDGQFRAAMEDAWAAARALLRKQGVDIQQYDGCWRLLEGWSWKEEDREKLSPATAANGRSASGAAAWGWSFALQDKKVPDKEVIVMAQVDENDVRLLKGFGGEGVRAKTKAIADKEGFDTIVVADEKDKKEAEAALRAVGKLGLIRVGPPWQ